MLIPSYFNLLSARHFEPDKATTLRSIVLIMLAAALIFWIERLGKPANAPQRTPNESPAPPSDPWWRPMLRYPMVAAIGLYILVSIIATIASVTPNASFWGSYQRLQGTYTTMAYIVLGILVAFFLRTRAQLERLIMTMVLGSLPAAIYGIIQHQGLDPLPWRGDVISRVASTMGNSIFVAAYLILVLPYALYLALAAFRQARELDQPESSVHPAWMAVYVLAIVSGLMLAFGAIEFGVVVRVADLRYWWVYPGALFVFFLLCMIPVTIPHRSDRAPRIAMVAGLFTLLYVLWLGISFVLGQGPDQQFQPIPNRPGAEWPVWIMFGFALAAIACGLTLSLPRSPAASSRLMLRARGFAMLLIALLHLLTIFFTQSRGPWIGLAAGMFVFITLLLLLAMRSEAIAERGRRWRTLLISHIGLTLVLGGLLIAFNTIDTPFVQNLRSLPYVGRMGRLLEVDQGTGLVRRLIWFGDDKAGGAVALISADPLRTIIGWGPESMFVAYNRFYPPALANIESRGASPDRAHEAYLDELINRGVLGLISYLFLLFSFFALAWRLIRHSDDPNMRLLLVACISAMVSFLVEGLVGIPIVITLMLQWLSIGLVLAIGTLEKAYTSNSEPEPVSSSEPEPAPEETLSPQSATAQRKSKRQARAVAQSRAATQARASSQGRGTSRRDQQSPALSWVVAGIIGIMALVGVWTTNIDNVYADMRFQQGQIYSEDPRADLNAQIVGMYYYLDAVRMEPQQDFYYLSLGRSLMSIVDIQRQLNPGNLGQPLVSAPLDDLLRLRDATDVQSFVTQRPQLALMSYAETILNRAYSLNPLNKDHSANMARLYTLWYTRLNRDPAILTKSSEWYQRAIGIAPQDVTIMNEYASMLALQGSELRKQGNEHGAQQSFTQAEQLLQRSQQLDPRYTDTPNRIADMLRMAGRSSEAVDRYVASIAQNPHALDNQITSIIDALRDQPEQLKRLRDAYASAVASQPDDTTLHALVGLISARMQDLPTAANAFAEIVRLEPTNMEARQNYTLVLSDMQQYDRAVAEATVLAQLAQQQQTTAEEKNAIAALLSFLKQKAGLGG